MKKNILLALFIVILVLVSYSMLTKDNNQNTGVQQSNLQAISNNLELQTKCADAARNFFTDKGYKSSDGSDYINHYNSRLNKCFIQITQTSLKDDFISIDIYDVFEGKLYALYMGHNLCSPADLVVLGNQKHCQLDSGSIWINGDDTKKADYKVGYGVVIGDKNTVGDENTQKQFLDHVQQFMNN